MTRAAPRLRYPGGSQAHPPAGVAEAGYLTEIILRDGRVTEVPGILRVDADGWAHYPPVPIPAGATVVAARLTVPLSPERYVADGTFSLAVKGVEAR